MSIVVHAISIGPRVITAATSVNVDRGPSLYSPSPRFQSLLHMAVPRTNQIKINEAETHLITLFGETSPFIHKTVEREREWRERDRKKQERRERERLQCFPRTSAINVTRDCHPVLENADKSVHSRKCQLIRKIIHPFHITSVWWRRLSYC